MATWPGILVAGGTGTTLYYPSGSGAAAAQGDYVGASVATGGINQPYRYYIEVTPGLSRLQVDLFDADVGLGAGGAIQEASAAGPYRDRRRNALPWNTSARYTLNDPSGVTQATLLGDVTGPGDNAWLTFFDSRVPTFRGSTTTTVNPAAANIVLTVPAGTATNDLLVAVISRDVSAAPGIAAVPPAGWVLVNEGACPTAGTCRLGVFRRVAVAPEPASYTFTLGAVQEAVGTMLRYSGVDTATPIEAIAFGTNTNATPTAPTANTTVANTRVVRAMAADNNSLAANPYPRDHTGRFALGTGAIISGAAADRPQAAAGATGTAAFALTASRAWRAVTFAIRPAAAAPRSGSRATGKSWTDTTTAVTAGDDINAFGLRAHDGTPGAGGTELNVYYDSHTVYGVDDGPAPDPNTYTDFPYVVSGCSCNKNDWDWSNSGSVTFTKGAFTRTFLDAAMSADNEWVRDSGLATDDPITGWTTDTSSTSYGIWNMDVEIAQTGGGANYGNLWVGNYQAAAPPPTANPTANAFRIYLATDAGAAPLKPYLEQLLTYVSGANPPLFTTPVATATTYSVTVRVVNPTSQPITFSGANLVTSNVPGPLTNVTYQGNVLFSQGAIVSQPAIGGIGDITWNPGTLAAGATGLLAYRVTITPTAAGQRIPVTGVVSAGSGANGTRATFVDETGAAQARATFTLGPVCELAATVNLLTAAVVSSVRAHDGGRGVVVEWDTVSEVGTVGFDLLRWDPESRQYVKVNPKLLPGLLSSPQGGRYSLVDEGASPFETQHYVLAEVEASGERRFHGPFRVDVDRASSPRDATLGADGYGRTPSRTPANLARALQTRRLQVAGGSLRAAAAASVRARAASAIKIGVDASGIYGLSAQAVAASFGLSLPQVKALIAAHRFTLSTQGRAVPWTPALGDRILFYGQALDSIYARDNVYWLRVGTGLSMATVNGGGPSPAAPGQSFLERDPRGAGPAAGHRGLHGRRVRLLVLGLRDAAGTPATPARASRSSPPASPPTAPRPNCGSASKAAPPRGSRGSITWSSA